MEKTEERKIDLSKLETGLESLTGLDYTQAEHFARRKGINTPMIQFSGTFQAVLAAKALGVTYAEVCALPIGKYTVVITQVANFLFGDLVSEAEGME